MGNKPNLGHIKLEKTTYEAGEKIFGEFYLKVSHELSATNIIVEVFGQEEAEWEELYRTNMVTNRNTKIILNKQIVTYKFPMNRVAKDDYIFPFIIELPENLPTSTNINLPRLKAKIYYVLTVSVNGSDIIAFTNFYVKEKIKNPVIYNSILSNLKGCLWIDRGELYIRATLSKDYYFPNEILKITVDVDSSKSHWELGTLICNIYQVISVCGRSTTEELEDNMTERSHRRGETIGNRYIRRDNIYSRNYAGFREQITIEVSLGHLKGDLKEITSSKGEIVQVAYCVELRGVMNSLFVVYGEEPELELWFLVLPITEVPILPKYSFKWKPKVIAPINHKSTPIFS